MRKGTKIRTKLSLGFALIILVAIALVSLVSTLLITREFESFMEKQQTERSEELAVGLSMQYGDESGWNVDYIHGMGMYALNDGYIIKVYDAQGGVVWDAENHDMEQCQSIMREIEERMQKFRSSRNGKFVTVQYDLEKDGAVVGFAEITFYSPYNLNENAFRFIDSLNLILLVLGVLFIGAAICVGIIFARKIAKPIVQVTEIADEIAKGNYGVRADDNVRTAELKDLSEAINNMAERIEQQEKLRSQLTSDVAHELRTPLANVSAQLEVILEGVFEPTPERLQGIYDEIERLSTIVAELEKLQQVENTTLDRTETDLLEAAKGAVAAFGAEAVRRGIVLTVSGDSAKISADRLKIMQVICNLVSNAVKYSPDGGTIEVRVKDGADEAVLSVRDEGIGIPENERGLIFERFYRTDKSRNRKTGGVGIGLAIVSAIVKAHGGRVEVESEEGKGSTFSVYLPKNTEN